MIRVLRWGLKQKRRFTGLEPTATWWEALSHEYEMEDRSGRYLTPAQIGMLVLRQSMIPVSIGVCIGAAGAIALSRFLEALLFQVHPRDPVTLSLAAIAIVVAAPAAIYIPMRRATRIESAVALREG